MVLDRAHLETPDTVTAFGEPPIRIDLLSSISGVTFDEAQSMAEKAERPRIVILQGRSRTGKPKCCAALSSCQEARRPS